MGEVIGLAAVVLIVGTGLVAVWGEHQRKLLEARARLGNQDSAVVSELQKLKRELQELRDTTTRYDMSFDAALQRIENRVNHLEGRVSRVEQQASGQVTQSSGL